MEDLLEPNKISESMKGGLARMFGDQDFKDYLTHAIAVANYNVLNSLKIGKPDDAKVFGTRLDTLKQLLEKGKAMYNQTEKLRSSSLEDLEKQKDAI
jgi:hypothetical protein